jgi:hypothetical protein
MGEKGAGVVTEAFLPHTEKFTERNSQRKMQREMQRGL